MIDPIPPAVVAYRLRMIAKRLLEMKQEREDLDRETRALWLERQELEQSYAPGNKPLPLDQLHRAGEGLK